jgi:hypothetical protein
MTHSTTNQSRRRGHLGFFSLWRVARPTPFADHRSAKGNLGWVQPFDTKTVASGEKTKSGETVASDEWRVASENEEPLAIRKRYGPY